MTKLLFVDTETGGLDPQKHSLLTAAFAVWEDGFIIDTLEVKIAHEEYVVTPKAMEINQIDLREPRGDSYSFESAMRIKTFIAAHFGEDKPTLVGQNVGFDIGFLKELFIPYMYEIVFSHRSIDTASVMRFLQTSGLTALQGSGLDDAIKHYNIQLSEEDRHTSLGDVLATVEVYNMLLADIKGEL